MKDNLSRASTEEKEKERMLDGLQGALIFPISLFREKVGTENQAERRLGQETSTSPGSAVPGLAGRRWHCTSSKAIGLSSSRAFTSRALSSLEPPWPFHPVSYDPPETPAAHRDPSVLGSTTGRKHGARGGSLQGRRQGGKCFSSGCWLLIEAKVPSWQRAGLENRDPSGSHRY